MRVQVTKIKFSGPKQLGQRSFTEWHLVVQDEQDETHSIALNSKPENSYAEGDTFDMDIQYKDDGDPKVFRSEHDSQWYMVVKRARPGQSTSAGPAASPGPVSQSPPRAAAGFSAPAPGLKLTMSRLGELAQAAQFVTLKMGINADENTKADICSRIFNTLLIGFDKLDVCTVGEPAPKPAADPRPAEDESDTSGIPF